MSRAVPSRRIIGSMSADLIISYDATPNDEDALALGKQLARTGATLALAYVRHAHELDPGREELAKHDAERRLEDGAAWLGEPDISRHVAVSPSTSEGLQELAAGEGASVIIFGSDYRTSPGRVDPGTSAAQMLEGGSVAVALAAAGLRTRPDAAIRSIAVPLAGPANDVARQTAAALATKLSATVVESSAGPVDLIVVGSQPDARAGRIVLGGDVRSELNNARSSVLVLSAGTAVLL
jgi:hypothetical protein